VLQLKNAESYCEKVEYSLIYLSFASFNTPYNPVRLVYENRTASIKIIDTALNNPVCLMAQLSCINNMNTGNFSL